MPEWNEFAQARGCLVCRDGRDPCNPLDPECSGSKDMDRLVARFDEADREKQARMSKDQEPFKGDLRHYSGGYDRAGVYHRPYLSPAEEETVRLAEREMVGLSAIELAAIENCLTAERMGLATEEDCMEALGVAGNALLYKPIIPGCRWCRNGEVACGLPEGCRAELARHGSEAKDLPPGPELKNDMVNLPAHYARFKVEPISFIVENGLNWFQGNIVKYASRAEHKHATPEEDISKIIRYAEMWREFAKGNKDWWR